MPTSRAPVLSQVLLLMLLQTEANPGITVSHRLTNNLRVEITNQGDRTCLQISRSSTTPSPTEWRMVLRNWPYPVYAEPQERHISGRCCLRAEWPTHNT